MSDLFTTTPPVKVLAVDPFLSVRFLTTSKKIFLMAGTRYTISRLQNASGMAIMKSATPASSWNGPLGTPPSAFLNPPIAVQDDANGLFHIFDNTSSPFNLKHTAFNTATDTYSSLVDSGEPANVIVAAARSNGDIVVVFESADNLTMKAIVFSGGSFGSATTLKTTTGPGAVLQPQGMLIDSSDTAHIIYRRNGQANLKYITFDVGGSVGTEVDTGLTPGQAGIGLIWNDRLLWARYVSGTAITLIEGKTIASPTWTETTIATISSSFGVSSVSADMVLVNGTTPWIIWVDTDGLGTLLVTLTCSYDGTTFGPTLTIWDALANPPSGIGSEPPADRQLINPSIVMTGAFTAEMVAQTDITYPDEDESLVWLAGAFPGSVARQMNRFSTSSSYAGVVMP